MNCQNCDAPVLNTDERCEKCGAKLLHHRVFFGVPKTESFTLTADEPQPEFDEPDDPLAREWQFPPKAETAERTDLGTVPPVFSISTEVDDVRWGGFFRRAGAFIVDIIVLALLTAVMVGMAYVGYKVGLAAHHRFISWNTAGPLVSLLTVAWIGLTTVYFVAFHGMEGRTIGKWLLGLRVVGANQRPISYRRALLRWIATVGLGCASFGLAFVWILWQREKRGWHDFLARTWVIRE